MDGYLIKPLDRERLVEALACISVAARGGLTSRRHPGRGPCHISRTVRHDYCLGLRGRSRFAEAPAREGHSMQKSAMRPTHRSVLMERLKPFAVEVGGDLAEADLASRKQYSPAATATRQPSLGRMGALEVRLRRNAPGDQARAEAALQGVLPGRHRDRRRGHHAGAARQGYLRQDLRSSAGDRPCRERRQGAAAAQAAGRRHVSAAARRKSPKRHGGFYTDSEFDIASLMERHRDLRFLELGRSCVLPPYRNKRTVELLWHGIWSYVRQNSFDVMIGCASLEGTDPRSACAAAVVPASFRARAGRLARERAAAPARRDEPDAPRTRSTRRPRCASCRR